MILKKSSIESMLLTIMVVVNCISFLNIEISNIYGIIGFYGDFLLLIVILILRSRIDRKDMIQYFYSLIFLIYTIITLFITNGGIGSAIIPTYSFLLLLIFYRTTFDTKILRILLMSYIFLNLFLVLNSTDYYAKTLYYRGQYINSNTISMVLMYTAIYIIVLLKKLKIRFTKILTLIVFSASIWAISNCQSRGTLISILSFAVMDTIIPKSFWRNKLRTLFILILLITIGTVFPYIYTQLYTNGFNFNLPFTQKSLYTGREIIWGSFFEQMNQGAVNWLFGLGSKADMFSGKSLNVHNNYLAVITNFGLIGYIMYYGFLVKQVSNIYERERISDFQISLLIGFLSVLIDGFVEISTLWHDLFFFCFLFLGMAISENNDLKIQNNLNKSVIEVGGK